MTNQKIQGCLRLMRPANIVTAWADILAGFGIAAVPYLLSNPDQWKTMIASLLLLLIATSGLYGGGVALNDVCDAALDQKERPERPIPKGIISKNQAIVLVLVLLLIGIGAASLVSLTSGFIALAIALLSFTYDAYAKHALILGPVNMALCRALNLVLGVSLVSGAVYAFWMIAFIPFVYIAGVSLISKQEVTIVKAGFLKLTLLLYGLAVAGVLMLGLTQGFSLLSALPYLLLFCYPVFSSLLKAVHQPQPQLVRKAVGTGIICLILLDAAMASGYAGWWYGLLLLILIPLSIGLSKKFSVT